MRGRPSIPLVFVFVASGCLSGPSMDDPNKDGAETVTDGDGDTGADSASDIGDDGSVTGGDGGSDSDSDETDSGEGTGTEDNGEGDSGDAGTSESGGSDDGSSDDGSSDDGSSDDGSSDDGGTGCDVAVYDPTNPPAIVSLSGNLGTHDPVLIEVDGMFYMFQTGPRIQSKRSTDLMQWQGGGGVFEDNPDWIADEVPGATDLWAPDISSFGGQYHLYYSASTFGSNHSCIGHATRPSLDSGNWSDHGSVVCSNADGADDEWNAIDPNIIVVDGTPWMSFGSFWTGIKMIELDASGARANDELYALASRPDAGGALEAPFIVERCGYFYLFVSFDSCCMGVNSTYKIMVGRSTNVLGPYEDKDGTPMLEGGGTLVLQSSDRWRGPGHNAILFRGDEAYNVYHSYDADNEGNPILRISEIAWDDEGWPISAGP